jgi:hypothetical protein
VAAPAGHPAVTVAQRVAKYPAIAPELVAGTSIQGLSPVAPAYGTARGRPVAPVPRWRMPAARPCRAILSAVAVLALMVAAFIIGSLIQSGPAPRAVTVPSAAPSGPVQPVRTQVTTVHVRADTLIGQPVAAAAQRLRQRGLSVRIRWRRSGAQLPGTVLSVRPAGRRPVGSRVTLIAALRPEHAGDQGDGGDSQGGHGDQGHGRYHHPGHSSAMDLAPGREPFGGPAQMGPIRPRGLPWPGRAVPGQTAPITRLA